MTAEELKALFAATLERFDNQEFASFVLVTLNANGGVTTCYDGNNLVPVIGALEIAKDRVKGALQHGPTAT